MTNLPLPRLDKNPELRNCLLKYATLKAGEIWDDPLGKHRIGCLDAASATDITKRISRTSPKLPSVAEAELFRRISVTSVPFGGKVFAFEATAHF